MTPHLSIVPRMRRLASGIELEVAEAGPTDGPLVILLHGFPDLWQGWHRQIEPLTSAGFRVLLPNQRGYGRSDKPEGIAAYDLDRLADDVLALAASERRDKFQLVGHDWGGIVAWWTAARASQVVQRLVILNAPHPGVIRHYLITHPTQMLKSWYIGFFQLPWIPEIVLSTGQFALLHHAVQSTAAPGTFGDTDRRYLVDGWSQPGALRAMINYYRALLRRSDRSFSKRVTAPTLILFSRKDPAENPSLASASQRLCDEAQIIWFDEARHWLQREDSERVNTSLLAFLAGPLSDSMPQRLPVVAAKDLNR